jgi:hypothetical protein
MRCQKDPEAVLLAEFSKKDEHVFYQRGVHSLGWLVQKQQSRPSEKYSYQVDPLLLSVGKLRGPFFEISPRKPKGRKRSS